MNMQKSNMEWMIQKHIAAYPLMEVRDVCKLLYQSVFGGGHMIPNPDYSLKRIKEEYNTVEENLTERTENVEHLGKGMVRIYLNAIKEGMLAETLNNMFVLSANHRKGTTEELEKYLDIFFNMCEKKEVPFDYEEAQSFITNWKEQGYPAVSHSETYRMHYQPAYRVVEEAYAKYYSVFLAVDRLLEKEKDRNVPIIVAIDGMAGSGKSTLGAILKEIYDSNLFHMDDYFLQSYQRTEERLAEPGGNVDYERFKEEIYDKLDSQDEFTYQKYDCSKQALGDFVKVSPTKLNIIEGAYSTHPYFKDRADLMFFMEIPDQVQIYRIGARNGEWMLQRFIKEWIPMEHRYFEEFGIRNKCISVCGD